MELCKLEKEIFNFIKTYKIFKKYDKILIGVSGGKDSMVLLNTLHKISTLLNFEVYAANFNHNIRKESEQEQLFVKQECEKLGIKCFCGSGDVLSYSKKHKVGTEEAARKLRYEFLFETLRNNNLDKIATAHHNTDLVETVLYRLFRGTGIYGVCGMTPVNEKLTKPMLTVKLKDVLNYVTINNVKYVNDPSNEITIYARNKIRHNIIPQMYEINESADNNILNFVKLIWEYREQVNKVFLERVLFENDVYSFNLYDDIYDSEIIRVVFLKSGLYPPNQEETKKIINMRSGGIRDFGVIKLYKKKNKLFVHVVNRKED